MKRFVSDIDRIMALIYEDKPLPPPVPKEPEASSAPDVVTHPELDFSFVEERFSAERYLRERREKEARRRMAKKKALAKRPSSEESLRGMRSRKSTAPPAPQLKLDFSSLDQIRSDAEITMNKLMTEEERGEEASLPQEEIRAEENQICSKEASLSETDSRRKDAAADPVFFEYGLDAVESKFLLALLNGENLSSLNAEGRLLSVLIDQINEKLFDEFADTVIENGTPPKVLADYEEDLKHLFLTENTGVD